MNNWTTHHEFNAMARCMAGSQRVNGVVSIGEDCFPISTNPANLYLAGHFLAQAEKGHLLCEYGRAMLGRKKACRAQLEERLEGFDRWMESGQDLSEARWATNALAIRARRNPFNLTLQHMRDYLSALVSDSLPHEIDHQFKFFVGDYATRVVLFTTGDLEFLRHSTPSGVVYSPLEYVHLDYLCNDSLGGNQVFLKMRE